MKREKYNVKSIYLYILLDLFVISLFFTFNKYYLKINIVIIIFILVLNLIYITKRYEIMYAKAKQNKRLYKLALNRLDSVVWELDTETNKMFISKNKKEHLSIINKVRSLDDILSLIAEEEREDIRIFIENIISKRILDEFILQYTIITDEDNKISFKAKGSGIVINNNFYLQGTIAKNNKELLNSIENSNNKNMLSLYKNDSIFFSWNVKENIISITSGIRKYLNMNGEEDLLIPYNTWLSYIAVDDINIYINEMNKIINSRKNENIKFEFKIKDKDKNKYWVEFRGKKVIEKNKEIYICGTLIDVNERKEKEIEISYLSLNDETTKIPNRRYFIKEASKYIKNKDINNIAFIFIDLDNFKYVNDTYGHDMGDYLLIEFSKIIKNMNINNSFFSRYGGDEFILVIYNFNSRKEIKCILNNIIKKLNKPLIIKGKEIFCTLSIGVSIYPEDGKELAILIKRADMAMYLAKINGKNKYEFFDLKLLEVINREFNIEKGLRNALDNNEINLVYQPKIRTEDEKLVGFEVLVRWNSRELGNISPNEFIPIAETSGLIIQIGKYIIEESFKICKQISLRRSSMFKMAINLSEVQIRDEEIVDFIIYLLKKYDLDPCYIEFEITESIIMKDAEKNIRTLNKFKDLGITLALDDFGTGYSSLSYLRTLPIDVLKIDKSFIDGILVEEKSEYIINAIIELSHYLNLTVVAEGVENNKQFEYLKKIKCDIIQGYYFSKPIKYEEIFQII